MKTIREYLDENKLLYGTKGIPCKKSVKARLRKVGKIRKMLEGTTFDEPMLVHGNTRLTLMDKRRHRRDSAAPGSAEPRRPVGAKRRADEAPCGA